VFSLWVIYRYEGDPRWEPRGEIAQPPESARDLKDAHQAAYREGPIFDAIGPSAAFLGSMGIVVTSLYLWGILARRDKTVFGMGLDSLAVLVVYIGGLAIYWSL